jgi:hypothetical protein
MPKFWVPVRQRFQSELIKRGHCGGCARSLSDAERKPYSGDEKKELVFCECRRVYVYNKQINHYRRAEHTEVER